MKSKSIFVGFILICILASCAPSAKAIPTEMTVQTLIFTPTPPTLTATATITSTPFTFIKGLNNIPQPDGNFINQAISENYLKVMGLSRDQVNLRYVEHAGIDGQAFIVMLDGTTGVPLAVYTDKWQKSTLKFFGEQIGIIIGTDTVYQPTNDELEIIAEFGMATYGVGGIWKLIEPSQGKYNTNELRIEKQGYDKVIKSGMNDVVAHATIFPHDAPNWILDGNFSQDELRDIMRERIRFMIKNNPNATRLVVVNEPYDLNNPDRQQDPFYKAWGGFSYIQEAFKVARETADEMGRTDVKLIFNDTDNHRANGGTTQATREIVQALNEENLIDYLGMQMHFNQWGGVTSGKVDTGAIANELEYYKNMGVPVLITELTYEPTEVELGMTGKEFNERLSGIFEQVFKVAIESGNVKGITFWGVTDKYLKDINWYTIFDEQGQPKQSYYIVLKTLYEGIK